MGTARITCRLALLSSIIRSIEVKPFDLPTDLTSIYQRLTYRLTYRRLHGYLDRVEVAGSSPVGIIHG
ncbi:hypothetical protein, partial [Niallia circulans]|uniref:hypothetical protein n=1 Tax=Niallia circulans TaxID=1397 RepID=UPI0026F14FA2